MYIFVKIFKTMTIESLNIRQHFCKSLNEQQRQQYSGQIALDLGHRGIKMVCEIFDINPVKTYTLKVVFVLRS